MGRWTQYDEDDYRLPEGMKRVGYDADSGTYMFRDRDGTLWEGSEGAQYGELKQVSGTAAAPDESSDHDDDDVEAASRRADGYRPLAVDPVRLEAILLPPSVLNLTCLQDEVPHSGSNASAYRMIFPFLLLVAVALLLVIRLVHWPALSRTPDAVLCPDASEAAFVKAGDTCWEVARAHGCSLAELMDVNPGLECNRLVPGQSICVPQRGSLAA
ncbi:hypothetical protein B0H21DRAFT_770192 [Amylocystis lapponica]|nr:hypothetical protein B0H21DRAFT_770192 [Amylocystis lapponica]